MIATELISAILQVIVFSLIPFIAWLIYRRRSRTSFLHYIGLYAAQAIGMSILISLVFVFSAIASIYFFSELRSLFSPESVQGKLHELGLNMQSIFILLIIAWIKTSLSEEIFFRGFIGRRLINMLGFATGNLLQAIIFGIVHILLFWALTHAGLMPLLFIFFLSTLAGWLIGYVKEKKANGSIIPGWIAHGLGNTISYYIIAYYIL